MAIKIQTERATWGVAPSLALITLHVSSGIAYIQDYLSPEQAIELADALLAEAYDAKAEQLLREGVTASA
jgi:hypothetical protein